MHLTIGSACGAKDSASVFDMTHELSMLKAGLLYADEIKLCSVGASLMSGFVEFHELTEKQIVPLIKKFGWNDLDLDQRRKFDLIFGTGGTRAERRSLGRRERAKIQKELRGVVSECRERFGEEIEEWIQTKADGLQRAVSTGLVQIHPFTDLDAFGLLKGATSNDPFEAQQSIDDIVFEYVEQADIAIRSGDSYPMFDGDIASLVEEMVECGLIVPTPAGRRRGRHAGLAGDLLRRLPNFEAASVDEVMDIREVLEVPLRGFRQAVSDFSSTIESEAWSADFGDEVDLLFQEKVSPRVEELEEEIRDNTSAGRFLSDLAKHGVTTGILVAVVGSVANLMDIAQISITSGAAGKTLAAGSVAAMVQAGLEERKRRRELAGNQLYFYYGAAEELRRSAGS